MSTKLSPKAENILQRIDHKNTKFGDLRIIAKEIKKDHSLAMELWSSNKFLARQLAILTMDKKLLAENLVDKLIADIESHDDKEKLQLIDWLFANQLSKDKKRLRSLKAGKIANRR